MRILRALSEGEQISTGEICKREDIPKQFAYKIIKKLAKAQFILIARGAEGGCKLNVDLGEKNLYDLMNGMESIKFLNACMDPSFHCSRKNGLDGPCKIHNNLNTVQRSMEEELKEYNIKSLLS